MGAIFISRRSALAAFGGLTLSPFMPLIATEPLTLAEIVRRNTLARGGNEALDVVRSLAVDVEIVEGGQTLTGRYAASNTGLVRIDIYADGKSVFSEGVDAQGAWMWTGGEDPAKPSSNDGGAALRTGAENHLFGWHRFGERGHTLALMPAAMIDGTSYLIVEVRYATGQVSYFYVDPASWHAVRRRDERAFHPDVDPTKQKVETRFDNFVSIQGVVAPHQSIDFDLTTGKQLATNRTLDRRINPSMDIDHFSRNRRAPADW